MLDVKNIFAVLCVSLFALKPWINLKFFHLDFCWFSNRNVLFSAINDAMASSPQGAQQLIHKCGLWKGDPDFTLVFQKSSVYRAPFPTTSTFTGSRYDNIVLFPLGGGALQVTLGYIFWKGDPAFIWCLILTLSLPCTIPRSFSARNDVTILTPPEGAASCQYMRILKGPPRLYNGIHWWNYIYHTLFPI